MTWQPTACILCSENCGLEVQTEDGRVVCYDVRRRLTSSPLVLYPDLIYRRFVGDEVVEEEVLPIAMRCFYPQEFLRLIEAHGFVIRETWGGYAGEEYGVGNELVVEFSLEGKTCFLLEGR